MTPEERNLWVGRMGARRDWWDLCQEPVVAPELAVIDAHFHLWDRRDLPDPMGEGHPLQTSPYLLDAFIRDTNSGHFVSACVYIECGSGRYQHGPAHLRDVGETEFAAAMAQKLATLPTATRLKAIIGHADLRSPDLELTLKAHEDKGDGLFRGIRQSVARLDDPGARLIAGSAPRGLSADPDFRRGVALLGALGLSFDSFQFHFQLEDLVELARATPGTTIIVNHLGGPIGFSRENGADDPVFAAWAKHINQLAELPNVMMKLGGMASIVTGYDGHQRDVPPSSEDFVAKRGAYFHHAIRRFGPERCLFGTNFPVDSTSISYGVLWNAFKLIAMEYGTAGRDALLAGTAQRLYRL